MDIKNNLLDELCKKHPSWKKLFQEIIKNSSEDFDEKLLCESFNIYLKHKNLLKQDINVNIVKEMYQTKTSNFAEVLFDHITRTLFKKQKNNFIKSLKTKSYKHLFNDEVEKKINNILDNKITIQSMKHQFFNKFLYYKNSKELLKGLTEFQFKNINWTPEYLKLAVQNLNAEILSDNDNEYIVQVNDYEACKELGSQTWCITRSERTFYTYTRQLRRQIIIFNFNLPIEDNYSLIGITIDINGEINHSHLKNDHSTPRNFLKKYKFNKINPLNELLKQEPNEGFKNIISLELDYLIEEWIINKNIETPSINDNYALKWAIKNKKKKVFYKIICNENYNRSRIINDFSFAIEKGTEEMAEEFINHEIFQKGVKENIEINMIFARAATKGYLKIVKFLIDNNEIDLKFCNHSALNGALYYKNKDVIKELIEYKTYYKSLDENLKKQVTKIINN